MAPQTGPLNSSLLFKFSARSDSAIGILKALKKKQHHPSWTETGTIQNMKKKTISDYLGWCCCCFFLGLQYYMQHCAARASSFLCLSVWKIKQKQPWVSQTQLVFLYYQNPIDYHSLRHGRKFSRPGIYFLKFSSFFCQTHSGQTKWQRILSRYGDKQKGVKKDCKVSQTPSV